MAGSDETATGLLLEEFIGLMLEQLASKTINDKAEIKFLAMWFFEKLRASKSSAWSSRQNAKIYSKFVKKRRPFNEI